MDENPLQHTHANALPQHSTHQTQHIEQRIARFPWLFAFVALFAELLIATVPAQFGLALHASLIIALLSYGLFGSAGASRRLILALSLVPITRVVSLSLPLAALPQLTWYPIVATVVLVAVGIFIHYFHLTRLQIGLRTGNLLQHVALLTGGSALGMAQYALLQPEPLLTHFSWLTLVLSSLVLIISTGLIEELLFRGVLQYVAEPVLQHWTVPYVAFLFAILHISYLSFENLLLVFLTGLVFGLVVTYSGSIIGVSLAHGSANVMSLLVLPGLAHSATDAEFQNQHFIWISLPISVLAFVVAILLAHQQQRRSLPLPLVDTSQPMGAAPALPPQQPIIIKPVKKTIKRTKLLARIRSIEQARRQTERPSDVLLVAQARKQNEHPSRNFTTTHGDKHPNKREPVVPDHFDLRTLRLNRGWTYTELARRTGLPVRHLAEIEHGLRPLDPTAQRSLYQALETEEGRSS